MRCSLALYVLPAVVGLFSSELKAADIIWDISEVTFNVTANEKIAVAEFPFHNAGIKAVRVLSVAPSCDCVTAKADKPRYAPGEAGVIHVEYTIGGREGRDEKSINVISDDAPDNPKRLLLSIDIPEPVVIQPRAVFWKTGEPLEAKAIGIVLAEPDKTTLGEVQCPEPSFVARLEPREKRGNYRVQITPTSTNKLAQATIRLNATIDGQLRVYILYAGVK